MSSCIRKSFAFLLLFFPCIKDDVVASLHSRFCLIFDARYRIRPLASLGIFPRFFGSSLHLSAIVFHPISSAQRSAAAKRTYLRRPATAKVPGAGGIRHSPEVEPLSSKVHLKYAPQHA
jgi:hypothetical protein